MEGPLWKRSSREAQPSTWHPSLLHRILASNGLCSVLQLVQLFEKMNHGHTCGCSTVVFVSSTSIPSSPFPSLSSLLFAHHFESDFCNRPSSPLQIFLSSWSFTSSSLETPTPSSPSPSSSFDSFPSLTSGHTSESIPTLNFSFNIRSEPSFQTDFNVLNQQ